MTWIIPITDRTVRDTQAARELQSTVDEDLKGSLNPSDLNRIESNSLYIRDELLKYGYSVEIDAKTDWVMEDVPTRQQADRIRQNVMKLRSGYYTLPGSPGIRFSDYLDWSDANSLEQNLANIDTLLSWMGAGFRRCGQFTAVCGNGVILP